MNYASIKNCDVANGTGVRISLFVSGCTHHCKNCFNEEAWDFNYGNPFTSQTQEEIIALLAPSYIKGLSLLGGEPMEPSNQAGLLPFLKRVKELYPQKDIWCYSGYTLEYMQEHMIGKVKETEELLSYIDVLVDGKFVESLKNPSLQFRGSSNQRLIDLPKTLKEKQIILWSDND